MTTAKLHDVEEASATVARLLTALPCAQAERQDGWLYALKQRAITAVAGFTPSIGDGAWAGVDEAEREDISTALRLAPATAQSRIDIARTLVNNLPQTCSALATGEISSAHATVIARETAFAIRDGAPESTIFQIEERALAYAEFHTPGQVANLVRTQIAKLAPEEFEETVTKAQSLRRVSCYNDADGMSTVVAILPAADAQIVINSIEAFILRQNQSEASATVDLPTLLGLAENPGQLAGYGAIPASVARHLASDASWKRFITEPQSGNLLDFGRESYQPPQVLKDFLIARDRTCRFPGCRRSALLSDLDHAQSWENGGATSPDNIGALCRRHHRLKTHDGWQIESFLDGSCTWTSPLGKRYFTPARPVGEPI